MKTKFGILVTVLLVVGLLVAAVPVGAQVVPVFQGIRGDVTIDGVDAPLGTVIDAYADGVYAGSSNPTTIVGQYAMLLVLGDADTGAALTFHVIDVGTDLGVATSDPAAPVVTGEPLTVDLAATTGPQPARHFLTVNVSPVGGGDVTIVPAQPVDGYLEDTVVDLTAVPAAEFTWLYWDGTSNDFVNPTTVSMTSDKVVTAYFEPPPPPGEFHSALGEGWSVLSTPVRLESGFNTFGNIVDPLDVLSAYRFSANRWYPVAANYVLNPLEGIYVNAWWPTEAVFIASTDITAPPTRNLFVGWSIVGPAPPYDAGLEGFPDMSVWGNLGCLWTNLTLFGGECSFSNVISPALNQPAWIYLPIFETGPDMLAFKGYWLFMEQNDILVGWSTTPLAAVV